MTTPRTTSRKKTGRSRRLLPVLLKTTVLFRIVQQPKRSNTGSVGGESGVPPDWTDGAPVSAADYLTWGSATEWIGSG